MVPQSLLPTPRLQPCLPCQGFPVIRGLSTQWMRGPLAGEDRTKHTQVACRWLSCVCALLLPLGLTPVPPTRIPQGQDLWGALLLESRASAWAAKVQLCSGTFEMRQICSEPLGPPHLFPFQHLGDCAYFTKWALPSPEPTW